MLPFLSNLHSFKAATHRLTGYAAGLHPFPLGLARNDLAHHILGDSTDYPSDIEGLYRVADRLHTILSKQATLPSHTQMLNHLSNATIGARYETLKNELPADNGSFRSYWNIPDKLLTSMMDPHGSEVTHPFPESLIGTPMIDLEPWKNLWLLSCQSSLSHPFLIPVPPKSIFGEGTTYRKFSTWQDGNGFSGSERFVIVVLDKEERSIAYITWYFWGFMNEIKGTGFSFRYLGTDSMEYYFSFDLRPCNDVASHYPQIKVKLSNFEAFQETVDMYMESDLSLPV